MSSEDDEYTVLVQGMRKPIFFSKELFLSGMEFKPEPGDIIIATYPKCGTTWMQNLVLNILRKGEPLQKPRDFFLASPFLEQIGAEDSKNMMIRPGAYKTHLPLHKLHWSSFAKYIYVARNPKDCCLSFYNHMKQIPGYQFDKSLDEFITMFVEGKVEYGSYFDHLIPWYNKRNAPNVFFITFEEMKKDLRKVATELIAFIGEDESDYFKENANVLEKILHNCSFEVMKNFINSALSAVYDLKNEELLNDATIPKGRKYIIAYNKSFVKKTSNKISFMRQGRTGNWKKELSAVQNERLNELIHKNTQDNIMSLWKDDI